MCSISCCGIPELLMSFFLRLKLVVPSGLMLNFKYSERIRALRDRIRAAILKMRICVLAIIFTAGHLSVALSDHTQRRSEDLELYHRILHRPELFRRTVDSVPYVQ